MSLTPYYQDSYATLYCMDSLEFCAGMPDCFSVDAWFADPPYGVNLEARVTKHSTRKGVYSLFKDTPEYVKSVAVPVVERLIKAGPGAVTSGVRCLWMYPPATDLGVIWCPMGAGCSTWGFQCSHPILYYGKCPYLANGLGSRPNGFSFNRPSEDNGHPCPKPVEAMVWIVNRLTFPGQLILDPFSGSGTTLVAAKRLGRKSVGIEICEEYCEISAKRLELETTLFDLADAKKPQDSQASLFEK